MKYILILLVTLLVYSVFIEPNILTVKKLELKDEGLKGLKVVYATDFHVKPYEEFRLKRIVKKINEQNPDIILLGGDYVNGHTKGFSLKNSTIAEDLSKLHSKYGTVAVMGNHDGWQGKKDIIEAFESNGITVLENEHKDFGKFVIAGVEDLQTATPDVQKALANVDDKKPVILLTHNPDIIKSVPKKVNLTLAGHLHGGQVVFGKPLIVPSKYGTKYAYNYFGVEKLFVSRGLGTSILPVRFNALPEIVVVEFE